MGTATITVTLTDNGPTGGSNVNVFTRTFTVTVTPNTAPTLAAFSPNTVTYSENDLSTKMLSLSGITDGETGSNEAHSQTLTVTATSSNTTLIHNPTVQYTSPNNTGVLLYALQPNTSGTATITVVVTDSGGTPGVNSVQQTSLP